MTVFLLVKEHSGCSDGNGGTPSYVVAVYASEALAVEARAVLCAADAADDLDVFGYPGDEDNNEVWDVCYEVEKRQVQTEVSEVQS